ncbi:hypothetical protein TorRG33x02_088570 [Trema orientale]|uniref:Uncharacterized protein n=1 Tax=Trema orientale TaxID=63057 RepID=A0A2P5FC39_TREOI|nr:hypothetical protein TorRG33x02_088570 [Trema orientale]
MEEAAGGDHIAIDVDALATDLKKMMCSTNLTMSSKCCIFRVPNILSRHNPKAYTPNAFSAGPFHYNKPHLKATQKIKLKYLHGLISRFQSPETMLTQLTKAIVEVQNDARECYAGPIDISNMDEFIKVLVLDGCFIIELLRKFTWKDLREVDDPIFNMSCILKFLYHDLILLENQIPWFVLKRLYNLTMTTRVEQSTPLNLLAIAFFGRSLFSRSFPSVEALKMFVSEKHESKHILDLLRNSMVLSSHIRKDRYYNFDYSQPMPSATSLKAAGIKFKMGTSESILDIKFRKDEGVLEIPPLFIQETTEPLFRNLISLEQCLPNCEGLITSYAILFDNLVSSTKDMEILCKKCSFMTISNTLGRLFRLSAQLSY